MDLSEYRLETLRDDPEVALYRAHRSGRAPVLFLRPGSRNAEARVMERFEQELALAGKLKASWAIEPLEITRHDGRATLALRDPGGQPLDRLLDKPLTVERFLNIAIGIAGAVRQMHACGLIHKDIKPANVFLDDAGHVKLTGFGFATMVPRERQTPTPPSGIAGTLAYMAPEQTGRMNRSIDNRSDLYSLGITFYEMLVGALPYTASKPMEWIYCHIARLPPPPSVRVEGVPPALEEMILKLLAKDAEKRYQTAAGIEHDLRQLQLVLRSGRTIDEFAIATRDLSDRLVISEKLYGRERELEVMVAAFQRVAAEGRFEFLLVSGPAGVGKSSIVNELHKTLYATRGLFAGGKFDLYKRNVPYATLAEAFQGLVRQILGQGDADLDRWRMALREACGPNGQLLVDLLPALALILGDTPALPPVNPQEAKNRFQFVFRRFIGVFAQSDHPLVLFLDDLQWVDAATLDWLKSVMTEEPIPHLLLIGAYRDADANTVVALEELLKASGATHGRRTELRLASLTAEDIGRLIAEALHTPDAAVQPLAELVSEKTHGNPFFSSQFLTTLNIQGLLRFDSGESAWRWDIDGIRAKGITDNVAEFMAAKLVRYDARDLGVIKQFACLGNRARITTLARILPSRPDDVDHALREFVVAGLVIRLESGYAFAHDVVREAAYSLIPARERPATHLAIARRLAEGIDQSELEENIFEIVSQYNHGAGLVVASEEQRRLTQLNLIAGKRAKAAAAYESALTYLERGCALLQPNSWEEDYRMTFELELHRAECQFVVGELSIAEERLALLYGRSLELGDRISIVKRQIVLYIYLGRSDRASELAIKSLADMGVMLPSEATDAAIMQEYREVMEALADKPLETLVDWPLMTDPYWIGVMDVFQGLLSSSAVTNPDLQALVILRMMRIGLNHGHSSESPHVYAGFGGLVLGWRLGTFDDAQLFGRLAIRLVDERGLDRYAPRVYAVVAGTLGLWSLPLVDCYKIAVRATDADREHGGIVYSGYAWSVGMSALFGSGRALEEVQRYAEMGLSFARKSKFSLLVEQINPCLFLMRALRGKTSNLDSFSDATFDQGAHETYLANTPHLWHGLVRYQIRKLQLQYYAGNYTACLELIGQLEGQLAPLKVFELTEYRFFAALALAAVLTDGACVDRDPREGLLRTNFHELTAWARRYPINFAHRASLVGAEVARLEGRIIEAEQLYESAINHARDQGLLHDEALAFELSGRFYAARGFQVTAEAYLRQAWTGYGRWGAVAKVRQLEAYHPRLTAEPLRREGSAANALDLLDLPALVEMSQAVSGEIVLERLIERLMVAVVEHAGATRGLLLLTRDGEMPVLAQAISAQDTVTVSFTNVPYQAAALPQSVLNYVTRVHDCVIIDDAAIPNPYSDDHYFRGAKLRSILCLPLLKQRRLVGVVYLENNLSSHIFTQDRVALLQVLASQAAISIENAELFADLKRTQEAARSVSNELQKSFDMIPALAWRSSADGAIEIANKRWHDYTGIARSEAQAGTWLRAFHPEDIEKVTAKWRQLSQFRTSGEFEGRLRRFDGEFRTFLVRVTPTLDADGRIENWHGTHTDIDALKRAQDSLRKSESELAEAQKISHTGSWTWNAATDTIAWSEECARIFGFDPHERSVSYASLLERIHPDDRGLVIAQHEAATRAQGDHCFEHRIVLKDGTIRTVLSRGHLVRNVRGLPIEYVGTILDITEQKRNEAAMREAQAALAQAGRLTALGELSASIAHEVNQPLMAIVANAATCLRWLDYEKINLLEARMAAKRIIHDGQRAGDIIASIRAMARKLPPKMAPLDLPAVIVEVLSLTRNELDHHHITVETKFGAEVPPARGDRVQMQQVILNLIMNAIDAMAASSEAPRILCVCARSGDPGYLWVSIADTGPGISVEDRGRIFDTFFTTKSEGIGIGLSICRSIVEAHHGRVWASANEPRGTVFHFTVPLYVEEPLTQDPYKEAIVGDRKLED